MAPQLEQWAVHYGTGALDARCGNCAMFTAANGCTLVKGPIRADYVCDRWAKRPGHAHQG